MFVANILSFCFCKNQVEPGLLPVIMFQLSTPNFCSLKCVFNAIPIVLNMRYFLPFATLVLFVVFTNVDMHAQELCGSGILHERLMQTDKAYQQATVNANA